MNKNILKKVGMGVALGLTLLPFLALAQVGEVPGPIITSPTEISDLVQRILNWVEGIVMTISLIVLLWAAILFLTAGASETAHSKAKNVLIYAIVGIAVAILAFSIQPLLTTILSRSF